MQIKLSKLYIWVQICIICSLLKFPVSNEQVRKDCLSSARVPRLYSNSVVFGCADPESFVRGGASFFLFCPLYFCDFSGGPDPLSPPLDPHMISVAIDYNNHAISSRSL